MNNSLGHHISGKALYLILLLLCVVTTTAQELSNLRDSTYSMSSDTLVIDALVVVKESIVVSRTDGSPVDHTWDGSTTDMNRVIITDVAIGDSLRVIYRTFPFQASQVYRSLDTAMIRTSFERDDGFSFTPAQLAAQDNVFAFGSLDKRGSISRGILVGNAQDLSVSSDLNLQLRGRLTDNISILADISDDNIPIQAEGNTQQLQEFDQVFIRLYDDRNALTAGDFQLRSMDPYFLPYLKKGRGASFVRDSRLVAAGADSTDHLRLHAAAAVSRGKFSRNVVQGVEGNQGPYRLTGADNEQFVIILSGTERVYIDGRLLERGQERDYIIDYNTAELTFTAKQLITKDRRIVAEFQYAERNFARSLFTGGASGQKGRWTASVDVYSEQDSRNQGLQQDLDQEDRLLLSGIGDQVLSALSPRVDSVGYSDNVVLYARVDSLGYDSVYVFSTDPERAFFQLSFTKVGQGNGDYIQDDFVPNGRVFRWVAPDTVGNAIVPQGDYAAVSLLVTPKSRRMVSSSVTFSPDERSRITLLGALSENDVNTFSELDSGDDQGHAFAIDAERAFDLKKDSLHRLQLISSLRYEQTSGYFVPIERYRPTEYERNWNLAPTDELGLQHLVVGRLGLKASPKKYIDLRSEVLDISTGYSGTRNGVQGRYTDTRWDARLVGSLLQTDGVSNSSFIRHKADISRTVGPLRLGVRDEHERNVFDTETGAIDAASYQFLEWEGYVANRDTAKYAYRLFYRDRLEERAKENELLGASQANEYGANFNLNGNKSHRLGITTTYRQLEILDASLLTETPEDNFLGRLEYDGRWWNRGVEWATFYDVASGLERRRQYVYLEVAPGQGVYIWNDYNEDGVKDLDEFEVAQFSYEADHIRTFTPTDEFEKTHSNILGQTIRIAPARWWADEEGGMKAFLAKFSDQAVWRSERKTLRDDEVSIFDPFVTDVQDSTLLSTSTSLRNTLYYQKSDPVWSAELNIQQNGGKQLLTNGFETRQLSERALSMRWVIKRKWTLVNALRWSERLNRTTFSTARDFTIVTRSAEPSLAYQPDRKHRLTIDGAYTDKLNALGDNGEQATIAQIGLEYQLSMLGAGNLQVTADFFDISFTGEENNALAFEMLDGLRDGRNATWGVRLQRTLGENLEMNITYDGRQSPDVDTIHAGGIQVRAFF